MQKQTAKTEREGKGHMLKQMVVQWNLGFTMLAGSDPEKEW
jgi:hypothetical protein